MRLAFTWSSRLLIALLSAPIASAQPDRVSVDPEREIIVEFRPNTVSRPSGVVRGALNAFGISGPGLRAVLESGGTEDLAQLVPGFTPERRLRVDAQRDTVRLTDWTHVFVLRTRTAPMRETLLRRLRSLPEVVYAEVNGRGEPDGRRISPEEMSTTLLREGRGPLDIKRFTMLPTPVVPNDEHFGRQWAIKNDGTSLQGSGSPGADGKIAEAWNRGTGNSTFTVAIVDEGMLNHPDFTGRVLGDPTDGAFHGTMVAGVAAARGNNGVGIAGVNWGANIRNEDYGGGSDADFINATISARAASVINNSWKLVPVGRNSVSVRRAFADSYRLGITTVASMGNQYESGNPIQYPAAYQQGVITVGATTNTDTRASYSSTGSWIDVTAPGGASPSQAGSLGDYLYSTSNNGGYEYTYGTSFSTPLVSGLASLLMTHAPAYTSISVYPDAVEQIIRLSADDLGAPGFDVEHGAGRVNAERAFQLLDAPNQLTNSWVIGGGTVHSISSEYAMSFFDSRDDLPNGAYVVKRHEVRRTIAIGPYSATPHAWGRGGGPFVQGPVGYSTENPSVGLPFTEVVSVSPTSLTLRTYVYEVRDVEGNFIGFSPAQAHQVAFNYALLGVPSAPQPAPLAVSISGPSSLNANEPGTWQTSIAGGNGTYAYHWYLSFDDGGYWYDTGVTDPTFSSQGFTSSVTLRVDVTSGAETASSQYPVYVQPGGCGELVACSKQGVTALLPDAYGIDAPRPNPFGAQTELRFALPEAARVRLAVYDVLGREVAVLADGDEPAGTHAARFEAASLPAGVYVYRFEARGPSRSFVRSGTVTLVR